MMSMPATNGPFGGDRRGDLDALRGVAMILVIVVHACLAYFPFPWPVQDPAQAGWLGLVFAVIHGFRMPLFFLLSGFFTMLLFRRRGLRGLLEQRALRILLPLVVAMLTILPLTRGSIAWSIRRGAEAAADRSPLVGGIVAGDVAAVERAVEAAADVSARDPVSGLTPLALAALGGDAAVVASLLDAGASPAATSRDGSTPLHAAAFMGESEVVELLLARGADPTACNSGGKTALDAVESPVDYALAAGKFLGFPGRDEQAIVSGRGRCRELLAVATPPAAVSGPFESLAAGYRRLICSPMFRVEVGGRSWHMFQDEVFDHLWFLWYLCWLVAAFAIAAVLGFEPTGRRRWWLVPLSSLPFLVMATPIGPDIALGVLPAPHLLLLYGCFFWFGAGTFAAEGMATPLGRHWKVVLPVSLWLVFPAVLAVMGSQPLAATLQTAYAWGLSLGLIGLFRRFFSGPSWRLRWLADASYWIYLAHLPLVIALQSLLIGVPWPAVPKFLAVSGVSFAALLLTYRWCVRYTAIGWLLNGPRSRVADLVDR
jgi:peptidoglycan/LPS O-acetylase OafA/YrhL